MNRKELLGQIRHNLGGTATPMAAELALDAVIRAIGDGLLHDRAVRLAHFGTFEFRKVRERRLTLPHSGKALTLPARSIIRFSPSDKGLK